MSLGKAVCLQSLNPFKTSPYFCLLFQGFYMVNWGLQFVLKNIWDWQTSKQMGLKIIKPLGRHCDGWAALIWSLCPLSLSRNSLPYNAGKADSSWKDLTVTGQWSVSKSRCKVNVIFDPFIWNLIQLTHNWCFLILILTYYAQSAALPSPYGRGIWWPGCEWTLLLVVQSFHRAVWWEHSSQSGWRLVHSVQSEEWGGSLMECLCNVRNHGMKCVGGERGSESP